MKTKVPDRYLVFFLLFLSGLSGFLVSVGLHPELQASTEAGQVLAGIIQYPTKTIPQYMCLVKIWTILNQISAILLQLGTSEVGTSLIIGGLGGALSFQALAIIFFSLSRNFFLSLTIPFFIYFMSYTGQGVMYPILFMENAAYGMMGLVFILLIIGLFSLGYFKIGSFLLGIAPCVHFSWGVYGISLVSIVLFFYYKDLVKSNLKEITMFFLFGLFVTLLSFIYQYSFIKDLPSLNYVEKKVYIANFIKYWDAHRRPFNYLSVGFFMGIFGSIISFIVIRFRKIYNSEPLFLFKLFIVSFFYRQPHR